MKAKWLLLPAIAGLTALSAQAFVVDWDQIVYWAGSGPNRAALVVQFLDNGPKEAYVWGYRWEDGEEPSGEDMFRAIATASSDLTLFTQYTGWMGNTVCGIGYSQDHVISDFLEFDFDSAREDPYISFDWFSANTTLGQTDVPGWDTQDLCDAAIVASKETHILDHPINARVYGYACYDYDWWQPYDRTDPDNQRWNAGWYKGYWSYWTGEADSESFSYSGLGMTSRKLENGAVDGWRYQLLDGPVGKPQQDGRRYIDGDTGASEDWHETLNYKHFLGTGVDTAAADDSQPVTIYNMQGIKLAEMAAGTPVTDIRAKLGKGLYIIRSGNKSKTIAIN